MEIKVELDKLESLIESRAQTKVNNWYKVKTVSREKILEKLSIIKAEIDKKHDESLKLWKESVDRYLEYMKKHMGAKQINPPPSKPTLPDTINTIDGYIDFFESILGEELVFEVKFLEDMFLKVIRGITEATETYNAFCSYMSGSAISDFSLTVDKPDIKW